MVREDESPGATRPRRELTRRRGGSSSLLVVSEFSVICSCDLICSSIVVSPARVLFVCMVVFMVSLWLLALSGGSTGVVPLRISVLSDGYVCCPTWR